MCRIAVLNFDTADKILLWRFLFSLIWIMIWKDPGWNLWGNLVIGSLEIQAGCDFGSFSLSLAGTGAIDNKFIINFQVQVFEERRKCTPGLSESATVRVVQFWFRFPADALSSCKKLRNQSPLHLCCSQTLHCLFEVRETTFWRSIPSQRCSRLHFGLKKPLKIPCLLFSQWELEDDVLRAAAVFRTRGRRGRGCSVQLWGDGSGLSFVPAPSLGLWLHLLPTVSSNPSCCSPSRGTPALPTISRTKLDYKRIRVQLALWDSRILSLFMRFGSK